MTWLVTIGLVMAARHPGRDGLGHDRLPSENSIIAQTMGVTTFALFRLFSSLETADEDESVFSGTILANRPLLIGDGLSVLTIILATELGVPPAPPRHASLTGEQWLVCIGVALSLIVVEEVKKALKIKTDEAPARPAVATEAAA